MRIEGERKSSGLRGFARRVARAVILDPYLYREAESSRRGFLEGAGLVLLSSIAGGAGMLISKAGFAGVFWGMAASLLGWMVWAAFIYFIEIKMMAGPMSYLNVGKLWRGMAFASAPGLIRVFGVFPPIRTAVFLIAFVWMLIAMVIAVRQTLEDSSAAETFFVCAAGWTFQVLFAVAALGLFHFKGTPE